MAKVRKTRGKTKPKRAAKRKSPAKAARRPTARSGRSASAGAGKRLSELQAENGRLREEIASLRRDLASRAGQADEGGLGDRPPSLGL